MMQLFIDGHLADIGESTDVTLTLESNLLTGAADFKGNRSLTITLPSTSRNRELVSHADKVHGGDGQPYVFHAISLIRDGVPIIEDGIGRILQTTPDGIQVAVTWGVRTAVDALIATDETLNDLTTNAAIEFHTSPVVDTYNDALVSDVFYAAMDTIDHLDDKEYYRLHVVMGNTSWDASNLAPASSYLHPSVLMTWILGKLETKYGMTFNWGDAMDDIGTLIVPLISKVPNDITFNGGYKASVSEPATWGTLTGNFIRFTTVNSSPIIATQSTPPEGRLECATAFSGMVKFSIYFYIDKADLRTVAYPIYKPKYGYRLDISIQGTAQSVVFMPEDTIIMADYINSANKVPVYVTGYLPVSMEVGDWFTMRVTCIENGIADIDLPDAPDYAPGIHVQGGTLWVNEIVGSLNEVQPTQQYPVEGNLPGIKPIDLIKFLCAVTGVFPVQASTADTLIMKPVSDVFDWTGAVDWSDRLLSPTDRTVAAQQDFTENGWARHNWWRWKEDETVKGDYDGSIDVDDETISESRDIFTFPFAATDGNNVPMYTSERKWNSDTQDWDTTIKWSKVEPRVMRLVDNGGYAMGDFDMDMSNIINTYYGDLAATMRHPVIITETVRMDDVTFREVDETKAVYLSQHGAYFALLSLELHSNGTAKAKLLRLVKSEEEE